MSGKKKPSNGGLFDFEMEPGNVLLSHGKYHTIIGAERFHFRVRDGIGWGTLAIITKHNALHPPYPPLKEGQFEVSLNGGFLSRWYNPTAI